jgi:hypothetical protein
MPIDQQQRVGGLRFLLYSRALHPELFRIYHQDALVKRHYEAQVWVTGLSHVVGFFHARAAMTEVIARADEGLPERGRLLTMAMRGSRDRKVDHINGIRFLTSVQVEKMSERLFARTHAELYAQASRNGIFVLFPEWAGGGLAPFSYVDYDAKVRHLHVFAYHAFPDELAIIKTQSIFELT